MADDIFWDFLINFAPKSRLIRIRRNPMDELDNDEFRKRFRLSKAAVSLILNKVWNQNFSDHFTGKRCGTKTNGRGSKEFYFALFYYTVELF